MKWCCCTNLLNDKLSRLFLITMSGKLKISSDMMRCYDGTGDVVAWLKKAKLVAKLMEIKDVASFIPLYLEGDAMALYLEMSEEDQTKVGRIEDRLKEAFAQGRFEAYGKLTGLRWKGEQVDVFANEIRRLAGLAGWKGEGLELTVKLAFITGFPDRVSVELKQVQDIDTVSVSDLITKARVLVSGHSEGGQEVVAVAANGPSTVTRRQEPPSEASGGMKVVRDYKIRCFRCGGPHMARECRVPRPRLICYRCGKGHVASRCEQGNGRGGAVAPEATPLEK